jgi:hypothetical protein
MINDQWACAPGLQHLPSLPQQTAAAAAGFSQEEQELQAFLVAQLTLAKVRVSRLRPRRMDFMDVMQSAAGLSADGE